MKVVCAKRRRKPIWNPIHRSCAPFSKSRVGRSSDAPVLLRGESGTGKSVLARWIHSLSPRSRHPFVVVNCPTLSEELLASELFGHAKGAFTGAVRDQPGRVEGAEGGTLFLDEIGDIAPALQAKLLRFIEEKEFERLGENKTRRANVRTVAATNRDLEDHVRKGLFREDLLYRLNVIELSLPPLRERPRRYSAPGPALSCVLRENGTAAAARAIASRRRRADRLFLARQYPRAKKHDRESGHPLARANHRAGSVSSAYLSAAPDEQPQVGGDFTLDAIEREHITRVIARTATLDEAAAVLGIDASTLWRKRKKYEG